MTLIHPTRRSFIAGTIGLLAAPAIVRASSIMPVRALPADVSDVSLAPWFQVGDWNSIKTCQGSPWIEWRIIAVSDGGPGFESRFADA